MSIHCGHSSRRRPALHKALTIFCIFTAMGPALAQSDPGGALKIDDDGTVHVPAHSVPISDLLSTEARAYVTEHLLNMQRPGNAYHNIAHYDLGNELFEHMQLPVY